MSGSIKTDAALLKQTPLRKRNYDVFRDNHMVQHANVDEGESLFERFVIDESEDRRSGSARRVRGTGIE